MTVLIVEDHKDVADTLKLGLEEHGYQVDIVHDGIAGEVKARTGHYDLMIVDWMLPGQEGTNLIQRLRDADIAVPILMLTARAEKNDQIEALEIGADDYLAKPFSFEVLLARLRALARRAHASPAHVDAHLRVQVGPLSIDQRQRTASIENQVLDLRQKEFQLLVVMAENSNQVLTRTVLAERIWDNMFLTDDVLNTTIGSLRRKLQAAMQDLEGPVLEIETLRGVGYRLKVHAATSDRAAA